MQRFLDSLSFSQPYLVGLLFMVVVVLFMPGCATASADSAGRTRNFATTAATTAGGAYIGAREGDGNEGEEASGMRQVGAPRAGRLGGLDLYA